MYVLFEKNEKQTKHTTFTYQYIISISHIIKILVNISFKGYYFNRVIFQPIARMFHNLTTRYLFPICIYENKHCYKYPSDTLSSFVF